MNMNHPGLVQTRASSVTTSVFQAGIDQGLFSKTSTEVLPVEHLYREVAERVNR